MQVGPSNCCVTMRISRGLLALLCCGSIALVAAQEDDGPANPACWINPTISMESDDGVISEQDACSVPMDNSVPIVDIVKVLNVAIFYALFIFCVKALCQSTM